jgi:serine phosphatase RsbU (regulator of sigma subunit)/anti-sigma regulatory factor (Ser/Thr protein kinase)
MFNLSIPHQTELFNHIAEHWRKITGTELFFLSLEGKIQPHLNGNFQASWPDILSTLSPHEPTFLTHLSKKILAAPLTQGNKSLGYLVALDADETNAPLLVWGADTLLARLLDAYALQDMTDELIGSWNQLELIYRVTQNLALTSDLMASLRSILQEIQKVVGTEDGFVLVSQPRTPLAWTACSQSENMSVYDPTLLNNLVQANRVVFCSNREACLHIWPQAPDFVENLMATNLIIVEENAQAAIGLINKRNGAFTAGDSKLLVALAQQIATIIKNFLTHHKLVLEERISRELEIAAEIQESLLPTDLPKLGGIAMAVSSMPASEVGGDFYDFVTINDRHLTLIIGDVSGKGIPAAMLTSVTRTMLRVEAMRGEPPHRIIQQAHNVLKDDLSRSDSFVTALVATIDTMEGTLSYASAGHPPALLWRAETHKIEQLRATSVPIGIMGHQQRGSVKVKLYPGDTLVFYTDGITEAHSPNSDLFGLSRLSYIVESRASSSPEALQQYIQSEVVNFWRHSANRDDATILVVKILPHSEMATPKNISTTLKMIDFSYPADMDYLSEISQQVTATCRELPALRSGSRSDDFIYLIELAISEICTNIIKHAYAGQTGNIKVRVTLLNNGVQLDFYDKGKSFDPNSVPEPRSDPHQLIEGGYGLHIVRQIMDVVSYETQPELGNHWHLIKFMPHH